MICQRIAVPQSLHQKIAEIFTTATVKKIRLDVFSFDDEDPPTPNDINNEDISWLNAALKSTKSITKLFFVNFESFNLVELAHALAHNSSVTKICFRFSEFPDGSIQIFLDTLKYSNVTKLDFQVAKSLQNTMELWRDFLSQNTTLKSLRLSSVHLKRINAKILFEGLKKNSSITSLALDGNQIGGKRLSELVNIVLSKPNLTRLNINYVESRSPEGAAALYKLLKANHLERMQMCFSFKRDDRESLTALVEALQYDRKLKYLSMCELLDGSQSFKLAEWIQKSNSVETLKLHRCHFDENASKALGAAISSHKSLKRLEMLNDTYDGSDSLAWIINGLKTNTSIEVFYTAPFKSFSLTAHCVELICEVLKTNESLINFTLSHLDSVSKESAEQIFNALSQNYSIEDFLIIYKGKIRFHSICQRNKHEKEALQCDWWILSHNIARTTIRYSSSIVFPLEIWPLIFSRIKYRGLSSFEYIARKAFKKYNLSV